MFHSKGKGPLVPIKLDLVRAFDTVLWKAIMGSPENMKFSQQFTSCIFSFLSPPSSLCAGLPKSIEHPRGLYLKREDYPIQHQNLTPHFRRWDLIPILQHVNWGLSYQRLPIRSQCRVGSGQDLDKIRIRMGNPRYLLIWLTGRCSRPAGKPSLV